MKHVLALNRFYLPGYQAGGPIVSLANMISALGDEMTFSVITSDRDINDSEPYPCIARGSWSPQGKASILYLNRSDISVGRTSALIDDLAPDVVYLNSFFDTWFSLRVLLASRFNKLRRHRLILAPRGEFSAGALSIKPMRKRAYIAVLRRLGLLEGVEWHASTDIEAADLSRALALRSESKIHVAADLGLLPTDDVANIWQMRAADRPLRVCFLSRISPMKNLLGAIDMLSCMRAPARLDIFGPQEDETYWEECKRAIAQLPSHIAAHYKGPVAPHSVHATLARYDAMILPTLGENYGHVIPEALSVGLPVLTSDRTPWKGLAESGVGYDGPLDKAAFASQLDKIASLGATEMQAMRDRAKTFARSVLADQSKVDAYRRLFAA